MRKERKRKGPGNIWENTKAGAVSVVSMVINQMKKNVTKK